MKKLSDNLDEARNVSRRRRENRQQRLMARDARERETVSTQASRLRPVAIGRHFGSCAVQSIDSAVNRGYLCRRGLAGPLWRAVSLAGRTCLWQRGETMQKSRSITESYRLASSVAAGGYK